MPTYDYECEKGHRFEVFQSMKDAPLTACVECGAPARRRIGPGAGFLFRGDGFYATDYRSKTYKEKAKSESGAGTSGTGKDAGAAADASAPAPSDTSASSAQPAADKPPKKPPQT